MGKRSYLGPTKNPSEMLNQLFEALSEAVNPKSAANVQLAADLEVIDAVRDACRSFLPGLFTSIHVWSKVRESNPEISHERVVEILKHARKHDYIRDVGRVRSGHVRLPLYAIADEWR